MQPGSATFVKRNDKEKKVIVVVVADFPTNLLGVWVKHFKLRNGHLTSL